MCLASGNVAFDCRIQLRDIDRVTALHCGDRSDMNEFFLHAECLKLCQT